MIPRLIPEISPLDAFCDRVAVAGIGDSRSWIMTMLVGVKKVKTKSIWSTIQHKKAKQYS